MEYEKKKYEESLSKKKFTERDFKVLEKIEDVKKLTLEEFNKQTLELKKQTLELLKKEQAGLSEGVQISGVANAVTLAEVEAILEEQVINEAPFTPENSVLIQQDFYGQVPSPIILPNFTVINTDFEIVRDNEEDEDKIFTLTHMGSAQLFNRPILVRAQEDTTSVPSGGYYYDEDYYLPNQASSFYFRVTGIVGTEYTIYLQDITNTTWYNWMSNIDSVQVEVPQFSSGVSNYVGVAPTGADNTPVEWEGYLKFDLPVVQSKTVYEIYIESASKLSDNIPTNTHRWQVPQLLDVTCDIDFYNEDASKYTVTTPTVTTLGPVPAGGDFGGNDNPYPDDSTAKYFAIQVTRTGSDLFEFSSHRKDAFGTGQHDANVLVHEAVPSDSGFGPEIKGFWATASIAENKQTAQIYGWVKLGKAWKYDVDILFPPSEYFAII